MANKMAWGDREVLVRGEGASTVTGRRPRAPEEAAAVRARSGDVPTSPFLLAWLRGSGQNDHRRHRDSLKLAPGFSARSSAVFRATVTKALLRPVFGQVMVPLYHRGSEK